MKRWKSLLTLSVCTFAVLIGLDAYSQTNRNADKSEVAQKAGKSSKPRKGRKPILSKFMRQKLTASSQVLEGLCTEDYALIEKGARGLHKVSRAESWRVSNDAMYRQHSLEFRSGVDKLLKAAKEKQLDSAALAWTRTTLNCIECHRWVKAQLISGR